MSDLTVANIIAQQMGGIRRLMVMVGASQFAGSEDRLQFSFKLCKKANKCVIRLDPDDTYTVQFWKISRKGDCKLVSEQDGIYCDMLQGIFKDFTGLVLKL